MAGSCCCVTDNTLEQLASPQPSLIDRGTNRGIAGRDVRVIHSPDDTKKKGNKEPPVGTVGGVVTTQDGPIIVVMHQYILHGKGCTVHSPAQIENNSVRVDDKSIRIGGIQSIITTDGYVIPLTIKGGLVHMNIRPFTDMEWDILPHTNLTSEKVWDRTVLDFEHSGENWYDYVYWIANLPRNRGAYTNLKKEGNEDPIDIYQDIINEGSN